MEKSKIIAEIEKKYEASKKEEEISKLKSVVLVNQLELETQRSKLLLSGKDAEQRAIQLKLLGRQHQIGRLELLNQKTRNRLQEVNLKTQQSELLVSAKEMALRKSEIKNKELLFNFSIGGAALILAFGGVTFYRSRKRKEWEQKQALTEERLRISRELHDDMGSTLSSILIYSEVAKNRSQKRIDNDEALSKIGQASRELVDKMSDIVWSLNPENENMDQLKNRMVAFAAIMLTPNNMLFRFAASDELNTFKLSPDQKKNIFLIFKEAIHNIVKYAKCESVDINMMLHNGQMVLNISDDGNGFSHHANGNGMGGAGIRNMKARAAHIGAELKVHSNSGKGVDIELRMPA